MKTPHYLQRLSAACSGLLVLSVIFLAGCGDNSKKNLSLSGTATYNGTPVSGGTLTLTPADGKTQPIKAPIDGVGNYLLTPPSLGEMKVAIETESARGQNGGAYAYIPPGAKAPDVDHSKMPKYMRIPPKYANTATSNLSVTIEKGKNVKNFELTD